MGIIVEGKEVTEIILRNRRNRSYNLLDIQPEDFTIDDIAHRMALLNRYGGDTVFPFAIGPHSVLVAMLSPHGMEFDGLMHDVEEAVGLNDMLSPVKGALPDYLALSAYVRPRLCEIFGMSKVEPDEVKTADITSFWYESKRLRGTAWNQNTLECPWALAGEQDAIAWEILRQEIDWRAAKQLFLYSYGWMKELHRPTDLSEAV